MAALATTEAQALDLDLDLDRAPGSVRVATFNANLNRQGAGVLLRDIIKRDPQVLAVAEIILRVRPDIILINEIDYDPEGLALEAFASVLSAGIRDLDGLDLTHRFVAPSNTGVPSGFDLDGDGTTMQPGDALGYGRFPGQYAMALLSTFPFGNARTFRSLPWSAAPWAKKPMTGSAPFFENDVWSMLPLSSKSHWDVPVRLPDGQILHLLASHPTPPVFDGPENRNGLRNAAEILFWPDYIDGVDWIVDDDGVSGGLTGGPFVVLGDLNNDPADGDGDKPAIRALLSHPMIQDPAPTSPGAAQSDGRVSRSHIGAAAHDTADWHESDGGPGNLRVDYVLPSRDLTVTASGVFWPAPDDPMARLVAQKGRDRTSSDHRLVWVDIGGVSP